MSENLCTSKAGGYSETQCESLKAVAKQYSKRSKGLLFSTMVNIKSNESLGTRLTIQDNGENIVLNVCPFCGGELRDLSHDEIKHLKELYTDLTLTRGD